MKATAR
jgi:hypothetical protein